MYIKEITLFGFKSYKEKTTIQDLFNGFNVLIGRNGSGKSNVFAALEYALSAEMTKPVPKASLLSQGRTASSEAAYIEIVFDNQDRKLMLDEDTVVFRRVLGSKRDRFFVNGTEQPNVKQLLETAGFTNPYFIVKQGKVQDLAVASDAERLKIISDVTGCTKYDDKIRDCRKSIEAGEAKRKEIEEMINELKVRQEALRLEVEDQKRHMKLDQTRRAIEVVLNDRKLRELQKQIVEAEARRNDGNVQQMPIRDELEKIWRNLQLCKRDIGDLELRKKTIEESIEQYNASRNEIASAIATKRQELNDLKRNPEKSSSPDSLVDDITNVQNLLHAKEVELAQIVEKMQEIDIRKRQIQTKISTLTEKAAKKDQKNAPAFQEYVRKELRISEKNLREQEGTLKALENSFQDSVILLKNDASKLEELKASLDKFIEEMGVEKQSLEEYKTQEAKLKTQLLSVWQKLSESEQKCAEKLQKLAEFDKNFSKAHGKSVSEGIQGVRQIMQDFRQAEVHSDVVKGYYGMVYEHLKFDPMLDVAVEEVAKNMLSHHVVRSRKVAQTILKEFNSRKYRGTINFIPLDTLEGHDSQSQQLSQSSPSGIQGAKPMMSVIETSSEDLRPVAELIFGKTLLCDSLECATESMRKFGWKCVTIDGETVSKKGEMTGGYIRRNPQKPELQRAKLHEEKELADWMAKKESFAFESNKLKEELRILKGNIQECNSHLAKLKASKSAILIAVETTEKRINSIKTEMEITTRGIGESRATIAAINERIVMLKKGDKTSEDKVKILKTFRDVSNEYGALEEECKIKHKEKSVLEVKLQHMKKIYYEGLESLNNTETNEGRASQVSGLVDFLNEQMSDIESKIRSSQKEALELQKCISQKQKGLDELVEKESQLKKQFSKICSDLEKHVDNLLVWNSKLQEHMEEAAKLGTVPQNVNQFETCQDKELHRKLKKINLKLKEVNETGINQKADQQYREVEENLVEFNERLQASFKEKEQLLLFLQDLDTRRGEALLKNIKVLQEQFHSIFCSIVPKGSAELIVFGNDTHLDRHHQHPDNEEWGNMASKNMFEGAKIQVNFRGKTFHRSQTLTSLSGGQKSIVALCLVLALQTINPVPFYLFDEVDQALDDAYRDSVAKVMGKMSEKSQFICTTFRREFVSVADKIFGVSFQHMCSSVKPISEDQALQFVESDSGSGSGGSTITTNDEEGLSYDSNIAA